MLRRGKMNKQLFLCQAILLLGLRVLRTGLVQTQAAGTTSDKNQLWQNGEIYYMIDTNLTEDVRIIHDAMNEWQRHTCVRFRLTTPNTHDKIIFVTDSGPVCYANFGRATGTQSVVLSRQCISRGVVMHELGHVLGLIEEHQRPDRNAYVDILYKNVSPSKEESFSPKTEADLVSIDIPYDYHSIMHMKRNYLSLGNKTTIATRDPAYRDTIGQREFLSFRDVRTVQLLYKCADKLCPNVDPKSCQKYDVDAFLDNRCRCVCPKDDFQKLKLCAPPISDTAEEVDTAMIVIIICATFVFINIFSVSAAIVISRRRNRKMELPQPRRDRMELPQPRQDAFLPVPPTPPTRHHAVECNHDYTEINDQDLGAPEYLSIIESPSTMYPACYLTPGADQSDYLTPIPSHIDKRHAYANN